MFGCLTPWAGLHCLFYYSPLNSQYLQSHAPRICSDTETAFFDSALAIEPTKWSSRARPWHCIGPSIGFLAIQLLYRILSEKSSLVIPWLLACHKRFVVIKRLCSARLSEGVEGTNVPTPPVILHSSLCPTIRGWLCLHWRPRFGSLDLDFLLALFGGQIQRISEERKCQSLLHHWGLGLFLFQSKIMALSSPWDPEDWAQVLIVLCLSVHLMSSSH